MWSRLVERAQQAIDEKEAKRIEAKLRKNTFDLDDFLAQIQQIKKMGNVKDLLGMVPGMGKALKGIDVDDNAFVGIESIIQSMTPSERAEPGIINGSRRSRIAKGCGRSVEEVNRLLKQFEDMKKGHGDDGQRRHAPHPWHAHARPRPLTMSASRPSFVL